jgi:hypothetical protein
MPNSYKIAQAQVISILLEAALKEYTADWLKNTDSVVRDETGKFAKKASSVKQAIEEAVKDPQQVKRKVNSELLKLTAKGLDKLVVKHPKFTDELLDKMFGLDAQKARDKLADMYGEINPGLPNAIRPDPLKDTLGDILKKAAAHKGNPRELAKDLAQAFELAGDSYNKLIDDLNNVESESEAIKLLGKLAATSIPIAAYLAATLTPEVAIGLLAGDTLATILASATAAQVVSFAANKGMDKIEADNPWIRAGVDLVIGISVGGTFSVRARQLEKKGIKSISSEEAESLVAPDFKRASSFSSKENLPSNAVPSPKAPREAKLPNNVKELIETDPSDPTLRWADYEFEVENLKVMLSTFDQKILFKTVRDVMFDVNGSMNKVGDSLSPGGKGRIAVKIKKTFDYITANAPEGTVFRCSAWKNDGAADMRVEAYKMVGFSEPQKGVMLGIIKEGKLVPFYPPFIEVLSRFSG